MIAGDNDTTMCDEYFDTQITSLLLWSEYMLHRVWDTLRDFAKSSPLLSDFYDLLLHVL